MPNVGAFSGAVLVRIRDAGNAYLAADQSSSNPANEVDALNYLVQDVWHDQHGYANRLLGLAD